jgi:DNA-directed RNA polymerase subunit RPC12/RpoP
LCEDYTLKPCSVCGAQIPVDPCEDTVTCQFCGSQFEVMRKLHGQGIFHGQIPNSSGLLIGGIVGFTFAAVIFTNVGRSLARAGGARAIRYISPKD